MGKEGYALRYELSKMTGRTSVPAVFVGGEFVGGCNDGGLGGVMTLESQGKLKGMCRPLVHDQCTWPAAGTPSDDGARPSRCSCPRRSAALPNARTAAARLCSGRTQAHLGGRVARKPDEGAARVRKATLVDGALQRRVARRVARRACE